MINDGLNLADYDEKLREMGNYLWSLEQQADLASAHGDQARVDQLEEKILAQARQAELFLKIPGPH